MNPVPDKLQWRGVSKAFGGLAVLKGLDLSVAPGRSLVIIGGSGQGKSVTIKIAAGLKPPPACNRAHRVMLLTCEYMSSAALMTLELDS